MLTNFKLKNIENTSAESKNKNCLCFSLVFQVAPSWSSLLVPPHLLDLLGLMYSRAQSLVLFFIYVNSLGDLTWSHALHIKYPSWCPHLNLYLQPSDLYLDDILSLTWFPDLLLANRLRPWPSPSHLMATPSFQLLGFDASMATIWGWSLYHFSPELL